MAGEGYISFQEAIQILKAELRYPEERALHYVKKFDKNKDGRLSASEFQAFKAKIQQTKLELVPASKVILLLKKFDQDGNGKLDIEEFADFYAEAKATHGDISSKFDELDKDKNGVLSPDEVVCVIQQCLKVDERMARYMVHMFDQNKDGSLDKQEFMTMWSSMFG